MVDLTDREHFLKECLDRVAERIRHRRAGRRFNVGIARRQLTDIIAREQGLVSFRLTRGDESILISYFDSRDDFERISDAPEWEPKAKLRGLRTSA